MNDYYINDVAVAFGVPQGAMLGSFLFIVFKSGLLMAKQTISFLPQIFMKMGIPQTLDPTTAPLPKGGDQNIALIGGGPASISCACFLARLGYKKLTVYEKEDYLGGLR